MSKQYRYSREAVARALQVTPSRVSQIAKTMGIEPRWARRFGFYYSGDDLRRMHKRDKTPGPKRNGGKK